MKKRTFRTLLCSACCALLTASISLSALPAQPVLAITSDQTLEDFDPASQSWELEQISMADSDPETYTFYNGINDNDYMAPATQLILQFKNGYRALYRQEQPLRYRDTTSLGKQSQEYYLGSDRKDDDDNDDDDWDDYSLSSSQESPAETTGFSYETPVTTSYFIDPQGELVWNIRQSFSLFPDGTNLVISYDQQENTVYAEIAGIKTALYQPIYKDVTDMPSLSSGETHDITAANGTRFFRVTGKTDTHYLLTAKQKEMDAPSLPENNVKHLSLLTTSGDSLTTGYAGYESDALLSFSPTGQDPSYIVQLSSASDFITSSVSIEEYAPLDKVEFHDPVYYKDMQFYTIYVDYVLKDGTRRSQRLISTQTWSDFYFPELNSTIELNYSVNYNVLTRETTLQATGSGGPNQETDINLTYPLDNVPKATVSDLPVYTPGTLLTMNSYERALYCLKPGAITNLGFLSGASGILIYSPEKYGYDHLWVYDTVDLAVRDVKGQSMYLWLYNDNETRSNVLLFDANAANAAEIRDNFIYSPDRQTATPVPSPQTTEPPASSVPAETLAPSQAPAAPTTAPETNITGESVISGKVIYTATSQTEAQVTGVSTKKLTKATLSKNITIKGHTLTVTTVAPKAFANCKKLKTVTVKDPAITVKKNAFKKCKKVTFVVGKKHVKAFKKKLKKAKIGCKYKVK